MAPAEERAAETSSSAVRRQQQHPKNQKRRSGDTFLVLLAYAEDLINLILPQRLQNNDRFALPSLAPQFKGQKSRKLTSSKNGYPISINALFETSFPGIFVFPLFG